MRGKKWTLGNPADKSTPLFWLAVVAIVLIKWFVVPLVPVEPVANFAARFIPIGLAPVNWALGLGLIAISQGPLLLPKYISIPLNILCLASILFFLGSWHLHPVISPIIGVFSYIEMNWLIPWWESERVHRLAPQANRQNNL